MTMEAYSNSYASSKSSYVSQNPAGESKRVKPAYPFQPRSLLHSVKKSQAKQWKKAPIAPMPPRPVKVYMVDAMNFRGLVQQLTGAPEYFKPPQSVARAAAITSLDVASPPNIKTLIRRDNIAEASPPGCTNNWYYQGFKSEALGVKSEETNTDGVMAPSSYSIYWCNFPPISPGTMTSLETSRVL